MNIELAKIYPVTSHTAHVGSGTTFVVIQGMKENGVQYIEKALQLGATKIVVEQSQTLDKNILDMIAAAGAELVYVSSARKALAELSAQANGYPSRSLKIIGITGTKGKTTTTFLIEHILRTAGCKTALLSTVHNKILDQVFDAHLTTAQPDYLHTFFNVCKQHEVEFVVMEVAAQALSLHRVDTIEFDVAAFTNFSLEHSEFYKTQEEYFDAKCQLFSMMASGGYALFNADDAKLARYSETFKNEHINAAVSNNLGNNGNSILNSDKEMYVRLFGIKAHNFDNEIVSSRSQMKNDIDLQFVQQTKIPHVYGIIKQSSLAALELDVFTESNQYKSITPSLLGEFSAYNILTAIAAVEKYQIQPGVIEQAIASFNGVPGRLQRFDLPNGAVAFIDNAHTPSSFEAILSTLSPMTDNLIVVFGAGGDRDRVKRPLMGTCAAFYADRVFITTDNPRSEDPMDIIQEIQRGISDSFQSKVTIELDRERAIRQAYALSKPGSIIALLGKGPVEYQHIKEVKIPFSEKAILRSL